MRPAAILAVASILAVVAGTCSGLVGGIVGAKLAEDGGTSLLLGGPSSDGSGGFGEPDGEDVPWTGAALGLDTDVRLDAVTSERHTRFELPEDAVSVTVVAESSRGAIRLSARFASADAAPWEADTEWRGLEDDAGEVCRLDLAAASASDFRAGPFEVCVRADADPGEGDEIRVKLRVVAVRSRIDAQASIGSATDHETSAESGFQRQFEILLPTEGDPVRIDISGSSADLDLRASLDGPLLPGGGGEVHRSESLGSAEWLVLRGEDADTNGENAGRGRAWVVVTDPSASPFPVKFRLHVTQGVEPPAELRETAPLPQPADPRELALISVVEILTDDGGGSGTIVTPDGRVLTAYHVVEAAARVVADGRPEDAPRIVVAVTLDPREVARDLFVAEVVHGDAGLDLAMLRITGNVRDVPLPGNYRFPFAKASRRSLRMLGEALFTVGYPVAGGTGTRVTQTVSRGIVSGYTRAARCREIKTDAFVSPGSSGGAAFDDRWEMVGVPVSTTDGGDGGSTLGNLVPLDAVPADWWK